MKAKDLIKILEKYPEREVKIHNGFVDDWQDLSIIECELEKLKPSVALSYHKQYCEKINISFHNKKFKTEWEYLNSFTEQKDRVWRDKLYSYKSIWLLQGKKKGKTSYDRLGSLSY